MSEFDEAISNLAESLYSLAYEGAPTRIMEALRAEIRACFVAAANMPQRDLQRSVPPSERKIAFRRRWSGNGGYIGPMPETAELIDAGEMSLQAIRLDLAGRLLADTSAPNVYRYQPVLSGPDIEALRVIVHFYINYAGPSGVKPLSE